MRRPLVAAALAAGCASSFVANEAPEDRPVADASADSSMSTPDGAPAVDGGAALRSTVTGAVVLPADAGATTIILAPEGFDPDGFHESAPTGPRATDVTGAWTIRDVPGGTYVVLAGYERDGLVLDPSTPPPKIVVSGGASETVTVTPVPKLVRALAIVGIKTMSLAPAITITDGEGEDAYVVSIVDMQGKTVLEDSEPASSSNADVTFAMDAGLVVPLRYRFRVTAMKDGGAITQTEDLAAIRTAAPDDT